MFPFLLLLAGAVGIYAFGTDAQRTRGTVLLHAGVPYRIEMFAARSVFDEATRPQIDDLLAQLTAGGALGVEMKETSLGLSIFYRLTPPVPTPFTLDVLLLGAVRVLSATRLDGKDWNAP